MDITIYKHEMDLKLYINLHSMLKNTLPENKIKKSIKRQFNYVSKYNVQAIYNKKILYLNKGRIIKMMTHNN